MESNEREWTVTRQLQWATGDAVVEVSEGSIDYTNPDALAEKYAGEFKSFESPMDAVTTAIEICRQWRRDGCTRASIGIGATGGNTLPFETCTFDEGLIWAKEEEKTLLFDKQEEEYEEEE